MAGVVTHDIDGGCGISGYLSKIKESGELSVRQSIHNRRLPLLKVKQSVSPKLMLTAVQRNEPSQGADIMFGRCRRWHSPAAHIPERYKQLSKVNRGLRLTTARSRRAL